MTAPPPPPRKPRVEPGAPGSPSGASFGPGAVSPPPRRGPELERTTSAPRAGSQGARRPQQSSRARPLILGSLAVLGVLVIAVVAFLVLRSGSTGPSGPTFHASTSIELAPGELTVQAVGTPGEFPVDVRDQVLSTLGLYVDNAIVNPLRNSSTDDAALGSVFDPAALTRLAGTDRALLLDEGLPKAVGEIDVTTPAVPMTALVDADGKVVLVTAGIQLSVTAQTKKGAVEIARTGSFVFALDAAGAWKITGWTVSTERGGKALGTPTTSTTPTTVAP